MVKSEKTKELEIEDARLWAKFREMKREVEGDMSEHMKQSYLHEIEVTTRKLLESSKALAASRKEDSMEWAEQLQKGANHED